MQCKGQAGERWARLAPRGGCWVWRWAWLRDLGGQHRVACRHGRIIDPLRRFLPRKAFSRCRADTMASFRLAVWLLCLAGSSLATPPYNSTWASLDSRPTPSWWHGIKFSVSLHWGVYSVPAYSSIPGGQDFSEWCKRTPQQLDCGTHPVRTVARPRVCVGDDTHTLTTPRLTSRFTPHPSTLGLITTRPRADWHSMGGPTGPDNSATGQYHRRVYGENFTYADFAPRFQAELYNDAKDWATLFSETGVCVGFRLGLQLLAAATPPPPPRRTPAFKSHPPTLSSAT